MAVTNTENKVQFGLKNAHFALATYDATAGTITYGTPVKIPGSVSMTIDPSGDMVEFYADDGKYYTASNNQGYSGKLEMAYITNEFRTQVLEETLDATDKVLIEDQTAQGKAFALLFEIGGDKYANKYVFYNCTASRPSIKGQTRTEKTEPQTAELSFTVSGRETDQKVKGKTTANTPEATANAWYTTVWVPGAGA